MKGTDILERGAWIKLSVNVENSSPLYGKLILSTPAGIFAKLRIGGIGFRTDKAEYMFLPWTSICVLAEWKPDDANIQDDDWSIQ